MGGLADKLGAKNVLLRKKQYGSNNVENIIDRDFKEFGANTINRDIKLMFQIYDDAFYDIPQTGEISHTTLRIRSGDYLTNFNDPKDIEILALNEEIEELQNRILELEASGAADLAGVGETVAAITEELEDISEQTQVELDAMTMSNTNPPHYLINGTGNSQVDGFLQDRNCPYYHEQHWGKQIYMYHPTRGDYKDTSTVVVYDGARGARGKRYLVKLDNTGDMKIKKSHWKSKWRTKLYKVDPNEVEDPVVD